MTHANLVRRTLIVDCERYATWGSGHRTLRRAEKRVQQRAHCKHVLAINVHNPKETHDVLACLSQALQVIIGPLGP